MEKLKDTVDAGVFRSVSKPIEISSDSDHSSINCDSSSGKPGCDLAYITITDTDTNSEEENVDVGSSIYGLHREYSATMPKKNVSRIRFNCRNDAIFNIKCSFEHCKDRFENLDAMTYHVDTYHRCGTEVTFSCHLCKKILSTKCGLMRHMNSLHRYSSNDSYVCSYKTCAANYRRKYTLDRHRINVHAKKIVFGNTQHPILLQNRSELDKRYFLIECWQCKEFFEFSDELAYHLVASHTIGSPKSFQCYLCKMIFLSLTLLHGHINIHHIPTSRLKCPFSTCVALHFRYESTLRKHIKARHARVIMIPPKTAKSSRHMPIRCVRGCIKNFFESIDSMMYHIETYHARGNKKMFECYLCRKTCELKRTLHSHMKNQHFGRPWLMCPFAMCVRTFSADIVLKRHIQRMHHTQEESATKEKVVYGFVDSVTRRTNGKGMVGCTRMQCIQVFDSWSAMTYHRSIFHADGIKNTFECHLCKKPFLSRHSLQEHIHTLHAGHKGFTCPIPDCAMKFCRKISLQRHLGYMHKVGVVHRCNWCNRVMASKVSLQYHKNAKHNDCFQKS